MKRIAFFDVDKTIFDGYIAVESLKYFADTSFVPEQYYYLFEKDRKTHRLGLMDYDDLLASGLDKFAQSIKGKKEAPVKSAIHRYYKQSSGIYPWVDEVVNYLKENNFQIYLVSAAPDITVEYIHKLIGSDRYLSTGLERRKHRFTGKIIRCLDNGGKREAIQEILEDEDTLSLAFGDSPGDIEMLQMATVSFLMYNSEYKGMRKVAQKHRFILIEKKHFVLDHIKKLKEMGYFI